MVAGHPSRLIDLLLDLIELLLAFGASCELECCLADFDLSGSVDVVDLISMLNFFGDNCPP